MSRRHGHSAARRKQVGRGAPAVDESALARRLVILSDIHANREALDAVLADLPAHDLMFCVGDVVGYGPDPAYAVQQMMDWHARGVLGNHDEAVLRPELAAGFNEAAQEALAWDREQLGELHIGWLNALPRWYRFGDEAYFVHGCPPASNAAYLDADADLVREAMRAVDTRCLVVGHTHEPMLVVGRPVDTGWRWRAHAVLGSAASITFSADQRLLINPGSVGQPRDGLPDASYVYLDLNERYFELRRVSYDVSQTQAKMRHHGFPTRLVERLAVGM